MINIVCRLRVLDRYSQSFNLGLEIVQEVKQGYVSFFFIHNI